MLQIDYVCTTDIGRVRSVNQDNYICNGRFAPSDGTEGKAFFTGSALLGKPMLFGVFDGVGGEERGELAAYIAALSASEARFNGDAVSALGKYCIEANERICRYAKESSVAAIDFNDNDYFQDLKTTAESKYVGFIADKVEGLLESEDYLSAARTVSGALGILPGNTELKKLQSKVERLTPVYFLEKYSPYSSDCYNAYVNGESFVMSSTSYTNGFTLMDGGHALFNLTGSAYTTLCFTLGHIDDTRNMDLVLSIYFDDVLEEEITVKWDALPERIALDITGVKQIKVSVNDIDNWSGYPYIGLANITLK